MALLIFLTRATWALIVAADLFAGVSGGGAVGCRRGGADGAGLLEFALLFLLELAFECVDGGRWGAVGWRHR